MNVSRIVKIGAIHYGLLMLIPLGIAAMQIHPAATLIAGVPLLVWVGMFLRFIHKSWWAAMIFWLGVAIVQWQFAVVFVAALGIWKAISWVGREMARAAGTEDQGVCERESGTDDNIAAGFINDCYVGRYSSIRANNRDF